MIKILNILIDYWKVLSGEIEYEDLWDKYTYGNEP